MKNTLFKRLPRHVALLFKFKDVKHWLHKKLIMQSQKTSGQNSAAFILYVPTLNLS